jgi:hypothetical protein
MDFVWVSNDVGDITAVTAGTGISGGGTSGAVTITNSMATEITAKADLIVGTGNATFDNLPVGSNGQVLTADSTVSPTGLKWATPAAGGGGFVFISRTSFTNAASQAFDSVFTSTYKVYCAVIESLYNASDAGGQLQLQFRYAGPTTQTTAYYGSALSSSYASTTVTSTPSSNIAAAILSTTSSTSNYPAQGQIYFSHVGNSSQRPTFFGNFTELNNANTNVTFGGNNDVARTYTGFLLKASLGTGITGTVSIYGLATS